MYKGVHRIRKAPRAVRAENRRWITIATTIGIGSVIAGAAILVQSIHSPPSSPGATLLAFQSSQSYTVQPGDTLSRISLRFCGTSLDYASIAAANGVSNPNLISVGEHINIRCSLATGNVTATVRTTGDGDNDSDDVPIHMQQVGSSGHFSYAGLETLWISAGGPARYAATAACIAEAESGGNAGDTGAAGERGLWQIAPGWGALSTYSPSGNAHAAVIISHGGTNWGPWTTRHACGV